MKWELLIIKSISKTIFNFKFLQVAIQKIASGANYLVHFRNHVRAQIFCKSFSWKPI